MREQQGPAPGTGSPAPPHLLGISCSARAPQTPRRREAGAGSLSAQGHRTAGESQNPPASARLPPPWPRAAPWTPLPLFSVTWIRKTFVHSDRSCETLHFRERLAGSSSRVGSCSLRPVLQLGGAPWPPRDRARAALSPAPAGCPPVCPLQRGPLLLTAHSDHGWERHTPCVRLPGSSCLPGLL